MTAIDLDTDVELQLLDSEDLDPRCEIVRQCGGSGGHAEHEFTCGKDAAWVAFYVCPHGARTEFFVCQDCHEEMVDGGNRVVSDDGPVDLEWRAL